MVCLTLPPTLLVHLSCPRAKLGGLFITSKGRSMRTGQGTDASRTKSIDPTAMTKEVFANLRRALDLTEALISAAAAHAATAKDHQPQVAMRPEAKATPSPEKSFYTIKEVCETTRLGKSTVYKAIAEGQLRIEKWGRRTLISNDSLGAWTDTWTAKPAGGPL